ncbi:hypothetical protein CHLNCDRAFT_138362 [Chlorella variabilis]|uniref:Cyanate hydratase n=1 Tax=Chlorella variabilis TaxID=554065 RepID=E1ZMV9_CHLVA|nr:hypothetical protein CHLNCDRAFT_138362 [Chlorella variabilis]EFN52758.1 hypothetical protein CHLNCDRAFT_138362 [Chlorella variabilis]|eukprot:XP_005844860.1 hypothetical protein CHLNCDRAFT_138362 [Chlorella variabilis]
MMMQSLRCHPAILRHSTLKLQQRCPRRAGAIRASAHDQLLAPRTRDAKVAFVDQLLAAKAASGKTFDEIAVDIGCTNAYTAQLFFNQAQLKPDTAAKLKAAVPQISEEALAVMQKAPMRSFDPAILEEPLIYRMIEAINHYGEALKCLVNEQFGDGIMSAIDFYVTVDRITGKQGEARVAITLNGKFLPHVEQRAEDNTAATGQKGA